MRNIEGGRRIIISIIAIAMVIVFITQILVFTSNIYTAYAQEQRPCPRYGGTLVIGRTGDSSTLNPLLTIDDDSFMVANQIFSSLIERAFVDGQLGYKGDLAEEWNISADGKTLFFRIVRNATWHDGTPLTAQDVKFTLELYLKEPLPQSSFFRVIESVDTPDNYTVIIRLKQPSPTFIPLALAFWRNHMIIPKHLYEGTNITTNPYNLKPIGSGPFRFVEWKKGDYILLERNENYFKAGLPCLDRIIIKQLPNTEAMLTALSTGEISAVTFVPEPNLDQVKSMPGVKTFPIFTGLGLVIYIGINTQKYPLSIKEVRQALNYAINREELIKLALGGVGRVQKGIFSSELGPFHNPDVGYDYNPDKANQILDSLGFKRGPDGIRVTPNGTKLSFRLYFTAGDLARMRASEIVKEQLKKIGVEIIPQSYESPTLRELLTVKYDFDLTWFGHATGPDPDRLYVYYHGSAIRPGNWNYIRYNNSEVNRLWDLSRVTIDPNERARLFREIEKIVMEDAPVIPIQERVLYAAHREEFQGFPPGPYWYANHMEKIWWTKGSIRSPWEAKQAILNASAMLSTALTRLSQDEASRIRSLINQANESYKAGNYDKAYELASQALSQAMKATETPTPQVTATQTQTQTIQKPAQQQPQERQDYTLAIIAIVIVIVAAALAFIAIRRRR
ncbi:MAG: ABC transporter substrate-binding protein [Sulfolobales archaeon]|jgi:peptide/nickel transport system substrate-binding protein